MPQNYFNQTSEDVLKCLDTQKEGLNSKEAAGRLEKYGKNALQEGKKKSGIQVFLEQFKDLLVIILIIAAVISMFSDNIESAIVIFAVLIMNAIPVSYTHLDVYNRQTFSEGRC